MNHRLGIDDDVCSITSSRGGTSRRKTCSVSWAGDKNGYPRAGSSGSGSTTSTFRTNRSRQAGRRSNRKTSTPAPSSRQNGRYSQTMVYPSLNNKKGLSMEEIAMKKKKARERWKNVGYCMIMVSSAASEFQKLEMTRKKIEMQQDKIKSFLGEKEHEAERRQMFDPSLYKRRKDEIYFTRELEYVARNKRRERTEAHIRSLRLVLRECTAFAAYPDYAQIEMTRLGILEGYGRGRVLLREGHRPEKVYFILSGTVVLTKCDKDLGKDVTVQIMGKGEIFGDTEVLEGGRRPATVTTCLDVLFWSVDAEDFKNSMTKSEEEFRNVPNQEKSENGEQATNDGGDTGDKGDTGDMLSAAACARSAVYPFLRSLSWFKDVPTMKFLEDPKAAPLVYYRNNKCIVASSKRNDHLYFVRKGKCDVIAKITIQTKAMSPPPSRPKSRRSTPGSRAVCRKPAGSPDKSGGEAAAVEVQAGEEAADSGATAAAVKAIDRFMLLRQSFPMIKLKEAVSSYTDSESGGEPPKKPVVETSRRSVTMQRRASLAVIIQQRQALSGDNEEEDGEEEEPGKQQRGRDLKGSARSSRSDIYTKKAGDVFGMTSLFTMDSELDTSLVSRGCECVAVSKTTFSRLLNKERKDALRNQVLFYPTYAEMKKKLLNAYSWSIYKDNLREDSYLKRGKLGVR